MSETNKNCSFCGTAQSVSTPLIAGLDGHICEACVRLASQVVTSWGRKKALPELQGQLPTPVTIKARLDEYIIGQDLAKEILAVAVYNHYKRYKDNDSETNIKCTANEVELGKSNVLVIGPTGTGKTLLASTLARIVGVPFAVADATTITQAGYVGEDVESILVHLLNAADGNIAQAEWGIVYIDEIDKLARSSESATGVRDVSGEGVQQALLKLVEGAQVKLPVKGRRNDGGEETIMDTSNILFIVGGAFSGLEDIVSKRLLPAKSIGFHTSDTGHEKLTSEQFLSEIQPNDLRRFGLIPEFIGRFPVLATLEPLDIDALVSILTTPRNALVRQYQKLFRYDDVELEITPDALSKVAATALERNTGARGLRGVMEQILRSAMFNIPSQSQVSHCRVDVEGDDAEIKLEFFETSLEKQAEKREAPAQTHEASRSNNFKQSI